VNEDVDQRAEYFTGLFDAIVRPRTPVELPRTKKIVDVFTLLRDEQAWSGPKPASMDSVPNKPAFQFNNQPTWAEFILLRLLERDGWTGAWVKNWGGRAFWRNPLEVTELSPLVSARLDRIERRTGGGGGCWDIVVSRGDDVLFVESKQRGRDELSPNQRAWMESALDEDLPLSSFVIVEWLRTDAR
jgi:hypothetical protein